jgi:hypothetical protein
MNRTKLLAMVSGLSVLALAATCLPASAYGRHGNHHGDMQLGLFAHAAGVSKDQIHSAFKNDAALKTDFQSLKSAKKAMDTCIVAGTCSNGEIAAYAKAQSTLTQEKMTVWQGLFAGAPNKAQAISLKGQLDSLTAQKHQIMRQVFGSANGTDSGTPQATQQQ